MERIVLVISRAPDYRGLVALDSSVTRSDCPYMKEPDVLCREQ